MDRYYVGLFGLGCVARGLIKIIRANPDIDVHWLCYVRDNGEPRLTQNDRDLGDITLMKSPQEVLSDTTICCVIEVMGGADGLAWEVVSKCLAAGMPVITANKALLAKHMKEVDEALGKVTSTGNSPVLRCEAAVCGGVPILQTLRHFHNSVGDHVTRIHGIVNGSTNYLLTAMESDSDSTLDSVIAHMQSKGYLEADYSLDLNGSDARHKMCILARMAGVQISESDCFTIGLPELIREDFSFATSQKCAIRLVGSFEVKEDEARISVMPTFVASDHCLAQARGADNVVQIHSQYLSTLKLEGAGAGSLPTGMAVASDLIEILTAVKSQAFQQTSPFPALNTQVERKIVKLDDERRNWILRLDGSINENMEDGWRIIGSVNEKEVYVKVNGTHAELTARLGGGVVFGVMD